MAGSESRSSRAPSSEHVGGRPTKIGAVATGPETERGSGAEHGEGERKHHGGDHENPVEQLAGKRRRPAGGVGGVGPGTGENKRPGQGGERGAPPIRVEP